VIYILGKKGQIRGRLDRAVANIQWSNMFLQSTLINSEMMRFDHCPIVMDTRSLAPIQGGRSKKHFEARWLQEYTVDEMIKAAWARAKAQGEGPTFSKKVNDVREELHNWDKEVLKNHVKRMSDLKRELERLRRGR